MWQIPCDARCHCFGGGGGGTEKSHNGAEKIKTRPVRYKTNNNNNNNNENIRHACVYYYIGSFRSGNDRIIAISRR